jgi:hypothetical protein
VLILGRKRFAPTTRQIDECETVACSTENSAPFHRETDMPLLQRNVVIERSGMPQASKRVAGRSEHGAAVRRPPDPFPPITPHPEGVPHLNLRLQARRLRYDERRWRLRLLEGVTVGLRSSSVWQGDPICESGAQLGPVPRAKGFSPLQRGKSTSAKLHAVA